MLCEGSISRLGVLHCMEDGHGHCIQSLCTKESGVHCYGSCKYHCISAAHEHCMNWKCEKIRCEISAQCYKHCKGTGHDHCKKKSCAQVAILQSLCAIHLKNMNFGNKKFILNEDEF